MCGLWTILCSHYAHTPQGQHLGELVCSCPQLSELHCDLFLPAAAGGAAAMLISLMYATRDVKAVAPQVSNASTPAQRCAVLRCKRAVRVALGLRGVPARLHSLPGTTKRAGLM